MAADYAIHAENLAMVYGRGATRVEALKGVELAVRPGDLWAIMGPSGSGKTTLLTILGLVTTPTGGSLRIDGENIYDGKQPDLARLRREKIGFIFQSPNLIPFLSVRQNVLLPLHLAGVRGQPAEARVRELLGYLDIADRADLHPNQLSGGEQQRVAIARALANNPKIILADEPTASLDTDRALNVMRLLRQVTNEHHATVLVVTHDHRLITEVDRVVEVLDGRIQ
ncbi:MAG: ABC transporter ATP-binding protein [Rhodanobacter sp.]|nr:MAG: ABC transporter ATP-binding protein [Rhodanobacter sp.]TAM40945.1 MAG: ABC transporter ATP-binding protein [Rhodanobacter sp.]TAN25655.1 MAG: ABC transporter ATP-binding protein [Rhodanobacter sp.]